MMRRELAKAWRLLLGLPKSLAFNLTYFPLGQALRLPVLVSHRVALRRVAGTLELERPRFGCVRLGFPSNDAFPDAPESAVWQVSGRVSFGDGVTIGPGFKIVCDGDLSIGAGLSANAGCWVFCVRRIGIGRGGLWAWRVVLADHDFHVMHDAAGAVENPPQPVEIGERVWIGFGASVLKGSQIAGGSVVGAGAVVSGRFDEAGAVLAGNPARIVKHGIGWRHA